MQSLTPQQKDAAFAHSEKVRLVDAVRWIKENFNVSTSKSALSLWLRDQRVERFMATDLAQVREDQQRASASGGSSVSVTAANSVLFANAVFNEFMKPREARDEKRLERYMNFWLRARSHELRDRARR